MRDIDLSLPVFNGFMFKAHNNDYCMGQYYVEDDWEITVVDSNRDDLKVNVAVKLVESGIIPDHKRLYEVYFVVFEDEKYVIKEIELSEEESLLFYNDVINSDLFRKLCADKKERLELEQEEKDRVKKEKEEQKERETYENLKSKFEPEE